jgi:hypothetical protein
MKTKSFYVVERFGGDGTEWSTENFNEDELKVIDRFLEELRPHIENVEVEDIMILNDDID